MTTNLWPNKRAKENIQDLLTNQTKANGYIKVYIVHYSLQQLAFEQIGPTWLSTISTGINLFLQLEYNPSIRKLGSVASFGKYVVSSPGKVKHIQERYESGSVMRSALLYVGYIQIWFFLNFPQKLDIQSVQTTFKHSHA